MIKIKRAKCEHADTLTQLAVNSEATWGFDDEFMNLFELLYAVTPEFISTQLVYELYEDNNLIGFFGIVKEELVSVLEFFYISQHHIGEGYGKMMWEHLISVCKDNKISIIEFVTSPEALPFYLARGAVLLENVTSLVMPQRKIPRVRFSIE